MNTLTALKRSCFGAIDLYLSLVYRTFVLHRPQRSHLEARYHCRFGVDPARAVDRVTRPQLPT